jgi:hypothetical protein
MVLAQVPSSLSFLIQADGVVVVVVVVAGAVDEVVAAVTTKSGFRFAIKQNTKKHRMK